MKTVFGRKNKSAVSPVIGTILMVAITVVLAAVLYVMVAGLGPSNTNQPPTAVLQGAGSWSSNATVTTYTFTVSTVTPTSANINPSQLEYIVSNSANTPLYSGASGLNTSSSGFTINVVFQDPLSVGLVSAGDRIQITVTPVANNPLVGGNLAVNFNGNSLATGKM
jgi:archaeal type IV pilus assembly protein PilA